MIATPMTTYNKLTVICRIWVLEQGCVYFHSSNASATICRRWIDEVENLIECDDDSNVTPFKGLKKQNAYLVTKRTPDPNNIGRKVNNLWIIIDPEKQLTTSQLDEFASEPLLADSQSEFERLTAEWLNKLQSNSCEPASSMPRPCETTPSSNWKPLLILFLIIALPCLFIFLEQDEPNGDNYNTTTTDGESEIDLRWSDEEIREIIRNAVEAANVPVTPENDHELLKEFVQLFGRIETIRGITPDDRKYIDVRKEDKVPHPFIEFFNQFPPKDTITTPGTREQFPSTAAQYSSALLPLVEHFRDSIEEEFGADLDLATPRELVTCLRGRLNYLDFYKSLQQKHDDNKQVEDPFLNRWRNHDPAYTWQSKLREHIKLHYAP